MARRGRGALMGEMRPRDREALEEDIQRAELMLDPRPARHVPRDVEHPDAARAEIERSLRRDRARDATVDMKVSVELHRREQSRQARAGGEYVDRLAAGPPGRLTRVKLRRHDMTRDRGVGQVLQRDRPRQGGT